jgi:hypothetical protein
MAGLVPAIHALSRGDLKAWMPGTRPGMTMENTVREERHI